MSGTPRKVLVLCLGNGDRGDDGFGPAVAHELEGSLPSGVELLARSGDILAVLNDWDGFDALVCVDAAASMGEPGRIHRLDLATDELPRELTAMSSHAFGLGEAVALARTLGIAPATIVVYAAEGVEFEGGAPMSQAIAGAVGPTAQLVAAEAALLQETPAHA